METHYTEPMHPLLDWSYEHAPLSPEEHSIIDEATHQVEAYRGAAYGEIRVDVVATALADLKTHRESVAPKVAQVVKMPTVFVVQQSPIAQ